MWANTVWGLIGLSVTCWLATFNLSPESVWLRPWLLEAAGLSGLSAIACFCWPSAETLDRRIVVWFSHWRFRAPWERREAQAPARTDLTPEQVELRKELRAFALDCAPRLANAIGTVMSVLKDREADNSPRSIAIHALFHSSFSNFPQLDNLRRATEVELESMNIDAAQQALAEFLDEYEHRQRTVGNLNHIVGTDIRHTEVGQQWLEVDRECARELERLRHFDEAKRLQKVRGRMASATDDLWGKHHRINYPASSDDPKAKRELQKSLDNLFKEGTLHLNRLIPAIENYDDKAERAILHEWQDRVLQKLDEAGVRVAVMSRFETFWKFDAEFHMPEGKSGQQGLLEGIWNEKLRQLRAIMDSFIRRTELSPP
jgi:hypothetical protein